jgi:DNA-binding transcriptional regulator GbsR (MarR family)
MAVHKNSRDAYAAIMDRLPACRGRVYATIARGGRLTRQEVSEVSGMPINTVCGRVKELLEANLVREEGSSVVVKGHRRALLTVVPPEEVSGVWTKSES